MFRKGRQERNGACARLLSSRLSSRAVWRHKMAAPSPWHWGVPSLREWPSSLECHQSWGGGGTGAKAGGPLDLPGGHTTQQPRCLIAIFTGAKEGDDKTWVFPRQHGTATSIWVLRRMGDRRGPEKTLAPTVSVVMNHLPTLSWIDCKRFVTFSLKGYKVLGRENPIFREWLISYRRGNLKQFCFPLEKVDNDWIWSWTVIDIDVQWTTHIAPLKKSDMVWCHMICQAWFSIWLNKIL